MTVTASKWRLPLLKAEIRSFAATLSKTLIALVIGLFLLPMEFAHSDPSPRRWPNEKIEGLRSPHNGPNCFNGTLLFLGFIDEVRFVDESEMLYFLTGFCQATDRSSNQGEVVIWWDKGTAAHSAVIVGPNIIFEKDGVFGTFGDKDNATKSHVFATTQIEGRHYFSTQRFSESRFKQYKCSPSKDVIARLSPILSESLIIELRSKAIELEQLGLTPTAELRLPTGFLDSIHDLAKKLELLNGDETHALYAATLAASITGHMWELSNEIRKFRPESISAEDLSAFKGAEKALIVAYKPLAQRIQNVDKSAPTRMILNNFPNH